MNMLILYTAKVQS